MLKKTLKTTLFGTLACITLTTAALAANYGGAIVTATSLNLRAAGNDGAAVLTTAPRGSGLVVRELQEDGWAKVWYKGTEGYMSSEFFRLVDNLEGNVGAGTVRGASVRMRSAPSYEADTLGYYNEGTQMSVVGVFGQWYKVSYGGSTGYIHSDYMNLHTNNPSSSGVSPWSVPESGSLAGQKIVETAMKYLGVPYAWGGTSTSGFDCSGFVYYVYKECGYSINRTAASIYANGTYVDKSQLQIGDTVHFTTSSSGGSIGHVGIYIGDGQFIHASSGSGSVVISDLSSNYYLANYYGARRII